MLELHVWGPAFSLPSIDPHCLAAIAYLQQAVPRGKWQLIASSDPSLSPSNELPALRNGDIWIGGFRNIFHYVAQHSAGEWILDAGLPEQDGADCVAFSSFIESHGQPLLDLSLYVSTLNYTGVTRPLYNTIQSFPLPYLTPPALRASAKIRTSYLNLSSLDIDSGDNEPPPSQSIIPERLRRPKSTVTSLLAANPEANASIRLTALATNFLEPLSELKGRKQFMVSDSQFTSLDCLVLGYLSLMLLPDLPQPWLSRTMREKFAGLCLWTEEVGKSVFGGLVTLDDAFLTRLGDLEEGERRKRVRGKGDLPWKAPGNTDLLSVSGSFVSSLADSMPFVGQLRRDAQSRHHDVKSNPEVSGSAWQNLTIFGSLLAGVGLVAGILFNQGLISLGSEDKKEEEGIGGFGSYSASDDALSMMVGQMDSYRGLDTNYSHGEPVVEADVDMDSKKVTTTESVS